MPSITDSNAPKVDARHVQNLTINITYHSGASQARYILRQSIHPSFQDPRTMLLRPSTYFAPMMLYGVTANHQSVVLRIQVSPTSAPHRSGGDRGRMTDGELYDMVKLSLH